MTVTRTDAEEGRSTCPRTPHLRLLLLELPPLWSLFRQTTTASTLRSFTSSDAIVEMASSSSSSAIAISAGLVVEGWEWEQARELGRTLEDEVGPALSEQEGWSEQEWERVHAFFQDHGESDSLGGMD